MVKKATTPCAPDLPSKQLDVLLNTAGKYGSQAPHFLMKLLYGARMCHPGLSALSLCIQRLTRHVQNWSAECDRRMHRLYEFLAGTDYVLTGLLGEEDCSNAYLCVWPDADLNGDILDTKSTNGCFKSVIN